jgi:hypothetical protein
MDRKMPRANEKMIKLYTRVWKKLDKITPLPIDCGKLCDKKCCCGSDQDGMLLFPGEELMYQNMDSDWFLIKDSNITLSNGYTVKLLVCRGECPREKRPLSCRIFPVVPYINSDEYAEFRLDLRSLGICPIVFNPQENPVDEKFIETLYSAFPPLLRDMRIVEFIEILSQQYDDTASFLSKFQRSEK